MLHFFTSLVFSYWFATFSCSFVLSCSLDSLVSSLPNEFCAFGGTFERGYASFLKRVLVVIPKLGHDFTVKMPFTNAIFCTFSILLLLLNQKCMCLCHWLLLLPLLLLYGALTAHVSWLISASSFTAVSSLVASTGGL